MKRLRLAPALFAALVSCTSPHRAEPPAPAVPVSSPPATASRGPSVTRFAVKGDWGAGTRAQREVTARMCALRERLAFDTVVTTGDNFYDPDGTATPANYHRPERCLIRAPGHRWRATWGNHDVRGSSTRTVLGADRYYVWSEGGVDFFMLDSNAPARDAQVTWLRERLRESRARVKIAVFHAPPYTVGSGHSDNETIKRRWVPLFERYDVTLVLAGHNHDYEHLRVRDVDYVVTGGGGRALHRCGRARPIVLRCESAHHFLLVTVSGGRVEVRAIDARGRTIDRFEIGA